MYERRRVLELFERYREGTAERAAMGIEQYRKGRALAFTKTAMLTLKLLFNLKFLFKWKGRQKNAF